MLYNIRSGYKISLHQNLTVERIENIKRRFITFTGDAKNYKNVQKLKCKLRDHVIQSPPYSHILYQEPRNR